MKIPTLKIDEIHFDVNLSCIQIIADEIANTKRVKQLQRSDEGKQLLKELALELFMQNKTSWLKD